MLRVHDHDNQHRQFPSSQREEMEVACGFSSTTSLQQPFHHTTTDTSTSTSTAFESPGMATSSTVGFPFTSAQWKELERQAMIFKYMVASAPVPLDLLLPITTSGNLSSSSSPLVGELKLRNSTGTTDPEPGRCKRTDGKKWRCSRDAAPDKKYCERHMHRGRPRSRKHVELHVNNNNNNNDDDDDNKRTRLGHHHHYDNSNNNNNGLATTLASCNLSQTSHFLGGFNTLLPYHHFPVFEPRPSLLSSDKGPSSLEWISMAGPASSDDPRRLHLMHQPKLEMTSKPSSSMFIQEEPFLNLNSYANFTTTPTGEAENDKDCSLFLNPDDVVSQSQETNHHGKKLSPCWLSPPPPPSSSWAGLPLGGPLAEVLRPSTASGPPSPFTGNGESSSPPATVVSSPSGVLQKTLNAASLSDSSGCSSSCPALGSSNAKPEISLF